MIFEINDTENEKQYVEKYQYKIGSKEWIDCEKNDSITIKENGINQIEVRAIGTKEGDISNIITEYAKIDKISPSNTTPTATKTTNSIIIKCTQTDDESGIDTTKTIYAIKEGNKWSKWQESNTFTNLKPNTKYVVKTKTSDKVGNTAESKELTINTEKVKVDIPKEDSSNIVNSDNEKEEVNIEENTNNDKNETIANKNITEIIEDNTVANIKIPKTGENYIIPILIFVLSIRAIIYYIKLIKIKNRI